MKNTHTAKRATVSEGMRSKALSGFVIGAARIGYVAVRQEDGIRAIPDPAATPLLLRAFHMARDGKPMREITAWLQENDVRGKRGDPVSLATVQRMLTDPYYCGLFKDASGKWIPGGHGAIVSLELFEAAQRKLASRRCQPEKLASMKRVTGQEPPFRPA